MLGKIKTTITSLAPTDITHAELGTANGWHGAQEAKSTVVAKALKVIGLVEVHGATIEKVHLDIELKKIEKVLFNLSSNINQIESIVRSGVSNNQYPSQRKRILTAFEGLPSEIETATYELETLLRIATLESKLNSLNSIKSIEETATQTEKKLNKMIAGAQKKVSTIEDFMAEISTVKAASKFSSRASEHEKSERRWFRFFIATAILTVCAIAWSICYFKAEGETVAVVIDFIKRVFIISTPAIFMKIALSKYSLERNLGILYNHRNTVLEQYNVFVNSISDDDIDAKNQLRLEIARLIFSDPVTGYAGPGSGSGLNINPVLNTVEKVSKKVAS